MFFFVLEVVAVSIVASLFASWIGLIPRDPKRRHILIEQVASSALLTIVLTRLSALRIGLSLPLLSVIVLAILWMSVRFANSLARGKGDSA